MSKIKIAIYLIIYVTYTLDFVVKICNVTQMSSIVYWLARWASKQLIAGSNLGLCKSFYSFFFFLKWDKKWVYFWLSFSERERKVKLALIHFSTFFDGFLGFERHSFQGRLRLSSCTITTFLIERTSLKSLCTPWFHEIFFKFFIRCFEVWVSFDAKSFMFFLL